MECKRLEDAVTYQWGDTQNLTHHATVPLMASGKRFGLLNVGSPGKEHFTEKELTLLQSVAFQIGTAVERINLFEAQKQRAEYFAQLDELTRVLWKINNIRVLPEKVVQHIARHFQWPVISLFLIKNQQLRLESLFYKGEAVVTTKIDHKLSLTNAHVIKSALEQQNIALGQEKLAFLPDVREKNTWHAAAVPLILSDKPIGLLYVAQTTDNPLSETERDVLKALGDHLSLLIETIRLHEQKQEMLLVEERNRLARDLHDSVNQKLFSLSLMARGAKECLPTDPQLVGESLEEIQTLSKEALADMRSLIWQLRPANVEAGIMTTLKQYGQKIGLKINDQVEGIAQLPRRVEETLWRIGQEALNNIRKHARTNVATIKLTIDKKQIRLSIIDDGCGFNPHAVDGNGYSLGLTSMKERAEEAGGSIHIYSQENKGTRVHVSIPLKQDGGRETNED
ncbi:sensor histidine kinase [Caldalkalibacillus uzonensis]|nr:histidine kinase [Caldalkalibacillus uzonensis]